MGVLSVCVLLLLWLSATYTSTAQPIYRSPPPPYIPAPVPEPPPVPCPSPYPPSPSPSPSPYPPSPSPSPSPSPTPRGRARCPNKNYPDCYKVWQVCPESCPYTCQVDCVTCRPVCDCNYPGAVCQDPRFVGGDGVTFYFHGHKNEDFCLVSDKNLHINAHLIGKRNPKMKRDFTWVQAIGIIFDGHNLLVSANKTSKWDDLVDRLFLSLDGSTISLPAKQGSTWTAPPRVSMWRTRDANSVTVEVEGRFKISASVVPITPEESRVHGYQIDAQDCFAHLDLGFKFYDLSDDVDGVLGQTYQKGYVSKAKITAAMPVLGGAHKFFVSDIFATDCAASRFNRNNIA